MIPVVGYDGHKVAVLGLGRSGLATAHALRAGGAIPICWDDNEDAQAVARDAGFAVENLRGDTAWDGVITLITSPGIPHLYPEPHPVIAKAWSKGVVVDNDIGLFFRSYATMDWDHFDNMPRVICITGSNGKSTTTALVTHILQENGKNVQMGGNIGRGVLDLEPASEGQITVLELSSYQIELARALAPDIAVFINLSPDHLDRHNGMGGYFAAKRRLFIEGGPERSVIGVDEIEGQFLANQIRQEHPSGDPVISISSGKKLQGDGWSVSARKGFISEWRKGRQMASIDMRGVDALPGTHNHQNACAAYAVCRSLNLGPKQIEAAFSTFAGLAHRSQVLGRTERGALVINDSKATNVDAAAQSLRTFDNIHWIVGGQSKEGGLSGLEPYFDKVIKAYLIGASTDDFATQLNGTAFGKCQTMAKAVEQAAALANEGEVILLAPACASFDQFDSFEARGDAFADAILPFLRPS